MSRRQVPPKKNPFQTPKETVEFECYGAGDPTKAKDIIRTFELLEEAEASYYEANRKFNDAEKERASALERLNQLQKQISEQFNQMKASAPDPTVWHH